MSPSESTEGASEGASDGGRTAERHGRAVTATAPGGDPDWPERQSGLWRRSDCSAVTSVGTSVMSSRVDGSAEPAHAPRRHGSAGLLDQPSWLVREPPGSADVKSSSSDSDSET